MIGQKIYSVEVEHIVSLTVTIEVVIYVAVFFTLKIILQNRVNIKGINIMTIFNELKI